VSSHNIAKSTSPISTGVGKDQGESGEDEGREREWEGMKGGRNKKRETKGKRVGGESGRG